MIAAVFSISSERLDTRCHVASHQKTAVPLPQSLEEVSVAAHLTISRPLHRVAENPDLVGEVVKFV